MNGTQEQNAPVFVKVDEYKQILDVIELVKKNIAEAKKTLGDINSLKDQEDKEIQEWSNSINDIEQKVANIDKMLFEPGGNY